LDAALISLLIGVLIFIVIGVIYVKVKNNEAKKKGVARAKVAIEQVKAKKERDLQIRNTKEEEIMGKERKPL
jgi:uncharacterized protein (UPF0333 family)